MCIAPAVYDLQWNLKRKFPVSIFSSYLNVPFEYLTVPVVKGYEEMLKLSYGDWHVFVKGGSGHGTLIVDADRSYKDVLMEQFGYDKKDFRGIGE